MINLKFSGVQISIIVLIVLLLICHGTKIYLDSYKNSFTNLTSSYNEISYINNKTGLPCNTKPTCSKPTISSSSCKSGLDALSDSELAVLYKVAYENAGLEVIKRELTV
jgi:hypothetical protein